MPAGMSKSTFDTISSIPAVSGRDDPKRDQETDDVGFLDGAVKMIGSVFNDIVGFGSDEIAPNVTQAKARIMKQRGTGTKAQLNAMGRDNGKPMSDLILRLKAKAKKDKGADFGATGAINPEFKKIADSIKDLTEDEKGQLMDSVVDPSIPVREKTLALDVLSQIDMGSVTEFVNNHFGTKYKNTPPKKDPNEIIQTYLNDVGSEKKAKAKMMLDMKAYGTNVAKQRATILSMGKLANDKVRAQKAKQAEKITNEQTKTLNTLGQMNDAAKRFVTLVDPSLAGFGKSQLTQLSNILSSSSAAYAQSEARRALGEVVLLTAKAVVSSRGTDRDMAMVKASLVNLETLQGKEFATSAMLLMSRINRISRTKMVSMPGIESNNDITPFLPFQGLLNDDGTDLTTEEILDLTGVSTDIQPEKFLDFKDVSGSAIGKQIDEILAQGAKRGNPNFVPKKPKKNAPALTKAEKLATEVQENKPKQLTERQKRIKQMKESK